MTNVIALRLPPSSDAKPALPGLVEMFALRRRGRHDPFWLKENAELAQILAACRIDVPEAALQPLLDQLGQVRDELCFFPQYYRLMLSLALDLQALGVAGLPVAWMADFVREKALIGGELSDMHRAEALLLLRRAGVADARDDDLDRRLMAFAEGAPAFCLPNWRAAYDLTHILFHASDYGRRPLADGHRFAPSLINAGMVAWLEDNSDLLAEVTLALRLAGQPVPALWDRALQDLAPRASFAPLPARQGLEDDYHQYLVVNWATMAAGKPGFAGTIAPGARSVRLPGRDPAALTELSLALLDMGPARAADWGRMRWRLWPMLSAPTRARIEALEPLPGFEAFFAGFSRAAETRPAPLQEGCRR